MKSAGFFARYLVAAAAAATAACTTPVGTPLESSASATAPSVSAGDTWTYHVRDGFTGLPRGAQQHRVAEVSGERVTVTVSQEGSAQYETWIYDREWNWLRRPATNLQIFTYSPPYRALSFPLAPGKKWRARLTATDPSDARRFPVWIDGTVVGWEKVKVPAGEFEALKVKRVVFFEYWEYANRGRSEIIEVDWYVPAVKQIVRREASSQYWSVLGGRGSPGFLRAGQMDQDGGPRFVQDDWLIAELVSYKVQ